MKNILKYLHLVFLVGAYTFFGILASLMTTFLRIEYISVILLLLYFLSIIGLFFVKKTPLLSVFPSLLFFIILGVFYYVDSENKGSICNYTHEGIVGKCQCDGYVVYQANLGTCKGERKVCYVSGLSIKGGAIPCENHGLPENFPGK